MFHGLFVCILFNSKTNTSKDTDARKLMTLQSISSKKKKKNTDIPPIRICVNKIGIRVAFKINAGYINELLMPIILKLFKSLKNKKNKNWENVTHLGTT